MLQGVTSHRTARLVDLARPTFRPPNCSCWFSLNKKAPQMIGMPHETHIELHCREPTSLARPASRRPETGHFQLDRCTDRVTDRHFQRSRFSPSGAGWGRQMINGGSFGSRTFRLWPIQEGFGFDISKRKLGMHILYAVEMSWLNIPFSTPSDLGVMVLGLLETSLESEGLHTPCSYLLVEGGV